MKVKRTIIKNNTNSYKKSSKKIKSLILDELVQMTGFTRAYIARLIRSHDKCIKVDNIVVRCDIGKTSTYQSCFEISSIITEYCLCTLSTSVIIIIYNIYSYAQNKQYNSDS